MTKDYYSVKLICATIIISFLLLSISIFLGSVLKNRYHYYPEKDKMVDTLTGTIKDHK